MSAPTLVRPRPTLPDALDLAPRPIRVLRSSLPAVREVLVLVTLYLGYTLTRLFADDDQAVAVTHAREVLRFERFFGLDVETSLNHAVSHVRSLEIVSSYWYASLHYVVTPLVLVLLWRQGQRIYRPARRALVVATAIALFGYLLYPTAPPRLMNSGYVDVLSATSHWGWWGSDASAPRGLGSATNQLAAMPSMHVGWALWVSVMLAALAHRRWQRILAFAYVLGTSLVVVVTGNHWVLDAVVGAAIMVGALVATDLVPGRVRVQRFAAAVARGIAPAECYSKG